MPSTISQPVIAPHTSAVLSLVVTMNAGPACDAAVRALCGDLAGLVRAVGFRDLDGRLSCVMAFGSDAWDRLFGAPRPKELHPFREIRGQHHAPATPGDIPFMSAPRAWTCASSWRPRSWRGWAMPSRRPTRCRASSTSTIATCWDSSMAWRIPRPAAIDAAIIGEEDAAFAGGSYAIVQKYLHDLAAWNAVPVERQERIVGRTKLDGIELDDAVKPTSAHNALTTIEENGEELKIVRAGTPFGEVGKGEFGTYFIGYARSPRRMEQMIESMFVGKPPGNYDRLLDFSRAVTGTLFFVPTATFLEDVAPGPAASSPTEGESAAPSGPQPSAPDGSLGIGSPKREAEEE